MHVVMLSDVETSGGAAIAASRLAEALVRAGAQVTRIVGNSDGEKHLWKTHIVGARLREKVMLKALESVSRRLADYTQMRLVCKRLHNLLMELHPDVINVHNLHGAGWSPDLVSVCTRYAPTVWTLHDMWSFTGRCAYNYDCRKFLTGCNVSCPTPTEYPALPSNHIARAWRHRENLFKRFPDLVAVCPSHWLSQEARCGLWNGHRVEVIPHGLPLEVYRPIEKKIAQTALGIETPSLVVLTAAQDFSERRKGNRILVEALRKVRTRTLTLITLGYGHPPVASEDITLHSLGYVDHERTKILAYSAADLFIHPAPVDNLPNTVMESIACGTPVAGFAVGGVSDMVRPGQTGWLAKEVSPEALAVVIDAALTDISNGIDLQESCRAVAEAEYTSKFQAQRYLELFKSL